MIARLTAKAILAAIAIAMAFFGVGLLALALNAALVRTLGPVGGYAVAGAILILPPLIWALTVKFSRPKKAPPQASGNELTRVLMAALIKETPWIAIVGAGLAGAANMFFNRNRTPR